MGMGLDHENHAGAMSGKSLKSTGIGLVFSGGGTCGSWQIGFWKALRELGLEDRITGVSGSSVGALNALLYVQGDIHKAEDAWLNFRQRDLLSPRIHRGKDGQITLSTQRSLLAMMNTYISDWRPISAYRELYTVVSILDETLPPRKRVNLTRREGGKPKYVTLHGRTREQIIRLMLATSAIPRVYPTIRISGKICADGDLSDKTPFLPLVNSGYQKIIILHLNSREEAANRPLEYKGDTAFDGRVHLYHAYPAKSLGNFLRISRSLTEQRMNLGYEEGKQFVKELQCEKRWLA